MARGIDAIAHATALDSGGASVGVLGNGFGVISPAVNRALYERMVAHGCLVTELPPGERPHAGAFPRRNRLISGRSEEHTSELQSRLHLVCRLLLEKKKNNINHYLLRKFSERKQFIFRSIANAK